MTEKVSLNQIVNINGKECVLVEVDEIQKDSNQKVYDINSVQDYFSPLQKNVTQTEQAQTLHYSPLSKIRINDLQSQQLYHKQVGRQQNPFESNNHSQTYVRPVVNERPLNDHEVLAQMASDCVKQCQYTKDSMMKIKTYNIILAEMATVCANQCKYIRKIMIEINAYHKTLANMAAAHATQCKYNKDSMNQINDYHENFANTAVGHADQCQYNMGLMHQWNAYHVMLAKTAAVHASNCEHNMKLMKQINAYHQTVYVSIPVNDRTKQCQLNYELMKKINAYQKALAKIDIDGGKQCQFSKKLMEKINVYHKKLAIMVADHTKQFKYKVDKKRPQSLQIREENRFVHVVHQSSDIHQHLPDNQNHPMSESVTYLQSKNENFDKNEIACTLRSNEEFKPINTQLPFEDEESWNSYTEQVFVVKCKKEDHQTESSPKESNISVIDLTIGDINIDKKNIDANTDEYNSEVELHFEENVEVKEEVEEEINIMGNCSSLTRDNYNYSQDEVKDANLTMSNGSTFMQFDNANKGDTYQMIEGTENDITNPIPRSKNQTRVKAANDTRSMKLSYDKLLKNDVNNKINSQHEIGKKRKVVKVDNIVNNVPKLSEKIRNSTFLRLGGDFTTSKRLRRTSFTKDMSIKRIDSSGSIVASPSESSSFTLPNGNIDEDTRIGDVNVYTNIDEDANGNINKDIYSNVGEDTNADTNIDGDTNADTNVDGDTNANTNVDDCTNADTNIDGDSNTTGEFNRNFFSAFDSFCSNTM